MCDEAVETALERGPLGETSGIITRNGRCQRSGAPQVKQKQDNLSLRETLISLVR